MKPEWKILQEIYHRLTCSHDDDLGDKHVEYSEDIIANAIRYFTQRDIGWIYPAKSYMVAICYARWLSEIYGGEFYEYLDDSELLYNNDAHYVPYSADKDTYDAILTEIGMNFDQSSGMVPDVREYFEKEFFLNDQ
jgi:hypothetical protein